GENARDVTGRSAGVGACRGGAAASGVAVIRAVSAQPATEPASARRLRSRKPHPAAWREPQSAKADFVPSDRYFNAGAIPSVIEQEFLAGQEGPEQVLQGFAAVPAIGVLAREEREYAPGFVECGGAAKSQAVGLVEEGFVLRLRVQEAVERAAG